MFGGFADSRTRTENIYSWISRFFADTLQRVSPRIRVSPQNILGRIGGLLSILSYTECPYIHLLIYVRFASGAVKIVRERRSPGGLGGRTPPPPPPLVPPLHPGV